MVSDQIPRRLIVVVGIVRPRQLWWLEIWNENRASLTNPRSDHGESQSEFVSISEYSWVLTIKKNSPK